MTETYVVVGASLAGARAVEALRNEGFDGRIILVGAEYHLPYDRPPLSKEVILGSKDPIDTLIHKSDFYSRNDIELLLGARARRIDTHGRRVELHDGVSIQADKVLLCTGTTPRRPEIPGLDLDGVHFLRTVDDAIAIRDRMRAGAAVVILGGGLIGIELAASALQLGNEVTVLERSDAVLGRVLPERIAQCLVRFHVDQGVRMVTGAKVTAVEGDHRVRRVTMDDGKHIEADLVVVGVGVAPAVDVAVNSGIDVDNGIVVDEFCETSVPGVYAAGDVASSPCSHDSGRIRLEHWQNAQNQGIAAARSMVGRREPYRDLPWFWSDQGQTNIQVAGRLHPEDHVVWRGSPESMQFTAFHLRDSVLVGAVGVNQRREVRMAMSLIDRRARPEPALLSDPAVDLRSIDDVATPAGQQ
ncbi:FAD-dependent oxidoreductase [Mycolicibacterium fortuitum]|uniref:FAD-dependent oxidoreductase n=1 Tax=Mycolicibacterium fortuitum TaxID=1766 RepID=UPI00148F5E41|nr:FAD-dependent oxidoreductase [Mycolicibacterium fortuitum]